MEIFSPDSIGLFLSIIIIGLLIYFYFRHFPKIDWYHFLKYDIWFKLGLVAFFISLFTPAVYVVKTSYTEIMYGGWALLVGWGNIFFGRGEFDITSLSRLANIAFILGIFTKKRNFFLLAIFFALFAPFMETCTSWDSFNTCKIGRGYFIRLTSFIILFGNSLTKKV